MSVHKEVCVCTLRGICLYIKMYMFVHKEGLYISEPQHSKTFYQTYTISEETVSLSHSLSLSFSLSLPLSLSLFFLTGRADTNAKLSFSFHCEPIVERMWVG